ncbi:MAG: hypothetical protein ACP5G1_03160 [Nanopusillaceae archaeon]
MLIYEKLLKREIRLSKKFKKDNKIDIICLESNSKDFSLNIIKNIDRKFNMNFKLNIKSYKYIEDIELINDSILILPIEGVFLSFLIYNYNKEEKYKYFISKKNEFFYNIGYSLSEFYISKYLKKEPYVFTKEYEDLLKFIYDIVSSKEKFVFGIKDILEYLSKYYL